MPALEFIPFMTAAKWIKHLAKHYDKSTRKREREVDELANVFGDPTVLAPFYIHPNSSFENPADRDEDDGMQRPRTPLFDLLEDFFARDIKKRDGRRHLFLLADAGMGKTSALVMLRLADIHRFWPSEYQCQLFKLGPDTLERIGAIESQRNTILLLDALDEDSKVIDASIEHRLLELITATQNFHRVVITCRTQFFPGIIERPGKIRVGNAFTCESLYLQPFSDGQVEDFLARTFPKKWRDWMRMRNNPQLEPARKLALSIRSLRCRPMLLAHIEDLVDGAFEPGDEFGVYLHMVNEWLGREEQKSITRQLEDASSPRFNTQELGHACARVAIWLQCNSQRVISRIDLETLIETDPQVAHLTFVDVGGRSLLNRNAEGDYRFSHYSIQEFLVVFAAISGQLSAYGTPIGTMQMLRFVLSRQGRRAAAMGRKPFNHIAWGHLPWADMPLENFVLQGVNLQGVNLQGVNLQGVNLQDANLQDANLQDANLQDANLQDANLQDANLQDANLQGANLQDANLQDANLQGVNLQGANLQGTNLSGTNLSGINLIQASLQGSNLQGSNLQGSNLQGSNLQGINLQDARLQGINLQGANLQGINLQGINLQGANLQGANLQGATLSGANLQGANLQEANLLGTNFQGVNLQDARLERPSFDLASLDWNNVEVEAANLTEARLQRAYLQGAYLQGVNLEKAHLQSANLETAHLQRANLEKAHLQRANLEKAHLQRAHFEGANLEKANLREARLQGANLEGANLEGANLEGANLEVADLEGANLQGAKLGGTTLFRANLKGVNLKGTDLKGANLGWANLEGANLEGANLEGANLDGKSPAK